MSNFVSVYTFVNTVIYYYIALCLLLCLKYESILSQNGGCTFLK